LSAKRYTRQKHYEPRPLDEDALARFERGLVLAPTWLRDFTLLLRDAGLRLSEARLLRASDIQDLAREGWLTIRIATGKSGRGRTIPVRTLRLNRVLRGRARGVMTRADDWLFPGRKLRRYVGRHPLTRDGVEKAWRRHAARSGQVGKVLHQLRHTLATELVRAGVRLPEIMAYLGWRRAQTALSYLAARDLLAIPELDR